MNENRVSRRVFSGKGKKIQITLSETAMKRLTELCEDKCVKRSALLAMALDKFYKLEKG